MLDETRGVPAAVWFHDYHLALAPRFVRARRPDLCLAHFWHIPWPPLEIFRVAPQAADLVEGLLANDLLGFQLPSFAHNFLHCAAEILGAEVDWEERTATYDGHRCLVRAFPIAIDVECSVAPPPRPRRPPMPSGCGALRARNGLVGVDRMDYQRGCLSG